MEKATLDTGAIDAVGTTGLVQLGPNAMNSVPRDAKLEIDIRDIDAGRRDATMKSVLKVGVQRCLCLISCLLPASAPRAIGTAAGFTRHSDTVCCLGRFRPASQIGSARRSQA